MSGKVNTAASVAARLRNRARATGDDYQALLTAYCFERLLYRLGASPHRDRFVLKGAMLLRVWSNQPYRATRDLDLLRQGDTSVQAIVGDLRAVVETPVSPDGIEFDGARIGVDSMRADDEYAGLRAKLPTRCDSARLILQIDIGLGDTVWPAPVACEYPMLLDFPRLTYSLIRARPWSPRNSRRWWCSVIETVASRTSSICTISRRNLRSIAECLLTLCGILSLDAGRRSRQRSRSA